jgi:hypothetical protein
MARHTVRTHKWRDGVLHSHDHIFVSLEEAIKFAKSLEEGLIKVYDNAGQIVHQNDAGSVDTYA